VFFQASAPNHSICVASLHQLLLLHLTYDMVYKPDFCKLEQLQEKLKLRLRQHCADHHNLQFN
jgi:hypothetical protein